MIEYLLLWNAGMVVLFIQDIFKGIKILFRLENIIILACPRLT